jgi:hypothetical protein
MMSKFEFGKAWESRIDADKARVYFLVFVRKSAVIRARHSLEGHPHRTRLLVLVKSAGKKCW